MGLPFVTYLTFLSDVCGELSSCSKSVQVADNLPWVFPRALDNLQGNLSNMIVELENLKKSLKEKDVTSVPGGKLSKILFPNFSSIHSVYNKCEYQGVPLPKKALGGVKVTRNYVKEYFEDLSNITNVDVKLLSTCIVKFIEYLKVLKKHLNERFNCETFNICRTLSSFMDLDFVFFPLTYCDCENDAYDFLKPNEGKEKFLNLIKSLPYKDKLNLTDLYFEYCEFLKYTLSESKIIRQKVKVETLKTSYLIKKFVSDVGDKHPSVTKFLGFNISFPVSEAIVESWGSSLDNVYKKKHHIKSPIDDLNSPATADMLVFIRLNGPPPSMSNNSVLLKSALISMKGPSYESLFRHKIHADLGVTSKVVSRIQKPDATDVEPWWRNF